MDKKEIMEKISELKEKREGFAKQALQMEQELNVRKTNVIRLEGAIGFLTEELKALETKKEDK